MNLAALQERKKTLEEARTNLSNQYQTVLAHEAECEFWINQLQSPPESAVHEEEIVVE